VVPSSAGSRILLFIPDLLGPEDGGATVLEGVGNYCQVYAANEFRKFKSFKTLYL
jgi:hypothetical protein